MVAIPLYMSEKHNRYNFRKLKSQYPRKVFPILLFITGLFEILVGIKFFMRPNLSFPQMCGHTTIIAACMNREATLEMALDSWIKADCISSIILIDWSSKVPIHEFLPTRLLRSRRLHVIRVVKQPQWVLSWAYNLAASFVTTEEVLKLDCDSLISSDFIKFHTLTQGIFYSGNGTGTDANSHHLNGIFYGKTSDFWQSGGYDERIQTYGFDDDNLYLRLGFQGLRSFPIASSHIHHMYHDDKERGQNIKTKDVLFTTQFNRFLSHSVVPWDKYATRVIFDLEKMKQPNATIASVWRPIPPLESFASQFDIENARMQAVFLHIQWYGSCPEDESICSTDYLRHVVQSYESARKTPRQLMLIIHAQHGLSNRIRAIASAAAVAKKEGRWLRVVWEKDIHINASFFDLFDSTASRITDVWETFDFRELLPDTFDSYNYLEPELGAKKYAYVDMSVPKHIYVKSAYRLNSTASFEEEDAFLKSLVPSKAVQNFINLVAHLEKEAIGVHIRSMKPLEELPQLPRNAYPEEGWEKLDKYRSISTSGKFAQEMRRILDSNPNTNFFLATDSWNATTTVVKTFGNSVTFLDSHACRDRSALCLQYALADLFLLSKCSRILGSPWSSFSEVAGALRGAPIAYAGKDF